MSKKKKVLKNIEKKFADKNKVLSFASAFEERLEEREKSLKNLEKNLADKNKVLSFASAFEKDD